MCYKNPLLTSTQKRNMANKTQVCNLKVWIKETLSLSKVKGVIAENILLMKYQKQVISATLKGERCPYIVTYCYLLKSWIYQVLPFIVSWDTSANRSIVSNWEFYFYAIFNFLPDRGSETVNQSELQISSPENWCYWGKMRGL